MEPHGFDKAPRRGDEVIVKSSVSSEHVQTHWALGSLMHTCFLFASSGYRTVKVIEQKHFILELSLYRYQKIFLKKRAATHMHLIFVHTPVTQRAPLSSTTKYIHHVFSPSSCLLCLFFPNPSLTAPAECTHPTCHCHAVVNQPDCNSIVPP